MTESEIADALGPLLALRSLAWTADSRLVDDLGMDSYDVVSLILDLEAVLGRELDEALQVVLIEASVGEICARLAD
jgi:acyl carrier protein